MREDLRSQETHFSFGENWRSYVESIDEGSIASAVDGLRKLFPNGELQGVRFLDIGCGSGMSMLAASKLGAREVIGYDIDPSSVAATRELLGPRLAAPVWRAEQRSVFDLSRDDLGTFDVVHSWGVLHHTGDMWAAIDRAASLVVPDGSFAVALYRRTLMCPFWRWEKKIYKSASATVQSGMRGAYKTTFGLVGILRGRRNPFGYFKDQRSVRGMDTNHDLHDWMGGYPYESVKPDEIIDRMARKGFELERSFTTPQAIGLFGSGCDEFVFRLNPARPLP